jgi:diguanylate cyclase (GGDEF)-like protein
VLSTTPWRPYGRQVPHKRSQTEGDLTPPDPEREERDERARIDQRTRDAVMGVWKVEHDAQVRAARADDLTGAYRREPGRTVLAAEIDGARRSHGRYVVAFVDVDGLKPINDGRGHAAGDQVLAAVVGVLRTKLRADDPIVRYGGDEFVCGLAGMSLLDAETRFDALRAAVAASAGVAVSVGLAALGEGDNADDLVHRADLVMLRVKARRKSRPA